MKWFIKRSGQALFTLWAVVTIAFAMIRLMPGGPYDRMRSQMQQDNPDMTTEQINQIIEERMAVNPQKPIPEAYVDYLIALSQGDFGRSTKYVTDPGPHVADIIAQALPWTVFIMGLSTILMFALALTLGALMAYQEGSSFDLGITAVGTVLSAIPYYIAAVVLITLFGYRWGVLPKRGKVADGIDPGFTLEFISSALEHAILPTASFVITGFGILALAMRGNSIQVLGEDYVRVAQLRGLSDRRIALRYVGRNAILPMWTTLLISVGFMFAGSVILEQLFHYRGIGYYLFEGVYNNDYMLMMGTFLVITIAVVISLFIADATYGMLDPRIKGDDSETY